MNIMFKGQNMQLIHLKYISERHGPMGDTMHKQRLQNPLDVVEGVTHAGQAATGHTYLALINTLHRCSSLHLALSHCQHSNMLHSCLSCSGFIWAKPGIV